MNIPNIIMITCHDLGDYLGCYDTPVSTPNLNALAKQGVVFENHFSTGTVCSPSRGSIMTGCYPHTHELMGLVHRGWDLNIDKCPHLAAILNQAGYDTHLFGFQHEHHDPQKLGYAHVHQTGHHYCDEVTPLLTEWLQERPSQAQPFFASVGFFEVHRLDLQPSHFKREEYTPANPVDVKVPPFLPDIQEVRQDLADIYGAINLVDQMVGRILQTLADNGLEDNTLVIFTTDHGASFMHSKATLYDGGTKVALLMRYPENLPAGHRVQSLTSHVDVLPTILELIGMPTPNDVQGKGIHHLDREAEGIHREYVFAEKNYTNYYDPARMIRNTRYKYIRKGLRTCIFDFIIPELELCPSSFRWNDKVRNFYPSQRCYEELYDLESEPGEMRNVIDDPQYAEIKETLSRELDKHLEATDDPFRHSRHDILMPTSY